LSEVLITWDKAT